MSQENLILEKLNGIEEMLKAQNIANKEILDFSEACQFLKLSQSHLYKLTSSKAIPYFCPRGKKLYFKKSELENWLLQNKSEVFDAEKEAEKLFSKSH